jgi:hypothetical protein
MMIMMVMMMMMIIIIIIIIVNLFNRQLSQIHTILPKQ